MHSRPSRHQIHSFARLAAAASALLLSAVAIAAPVVQNVSGALDHKGSITITGSGFGAKSKAAPLVYDDASGSSILQLWDGAWPNTAGEYNTVYHTPIRNIGLPHSHDVRYIAGAHATNQKLRPPDTTSPSSNRLRPSRRISISAGTSAQTTPGTSAATIISRPSTTRKATTRTPSKAGIRPMGRRTPTVPPMAHSGWLRPIPG